MARKKRSEQRENISAVLRDIAMTLTKAGKRVKSWPIAVAGFPALEPGIEETFRKGRAASLLAKKSPDPENFHNWRKRVKDHWYHVRLLEDLWTEWVQVTKPVCGTWKTWLGDDHDLVILRDRHIREPDLFGNEKFIELVVNLIEKRQKELRANAESLGRVALRTQEPRKI